MKFHNVIYTYNTIERERESEIIVLYSISVELTINNL